MTKLAFKRIAIVAHPQMTEAIHELQDIATYLQGHKVATVTGLLDDESLRQQVRQGEIDLLIALGGDGTMLRAGHLCAPQNIPILGINMGRFGFLTEIKGSEWKSVLPKLFEGSYWLEKRMMLRGELRRAEQLVGAWEVLNEIVVSRGHYLHPVHLIAHVDGRYLTTYVADALIVSTATGSTAYALAAGGPILPPELRNMLLVAVAPHLSLDRAIVLPEGSTVSIRVKTEHPAVLAADGQSPIDLANEDWINVFASEHTVQFLRFQDPGYFYRNLTPHMSQNPSTGKQLR